MMVSLLGMGSVALLLVAEPPSTAATEKDKAALQGKWEIVSAEFEGKPGTRAYKAGTVVVIEGDQLHFTDGFAKSPTSKIRLDASKNPKEIDIGAGEENAILGIYLLEGDSLKLCMNLGGQRPRSFATKAGDSTNLMVLKRVKP